MENSKVHCRGYLPTPLQPVLRIPNAAPEILPQHDADPACLWSVMIPAYNCINYLSKTIRSVLAQDVGQAQMQIEVIDDCSTDGDVEALVEEIGRGRVGFFRQPYNVGSLRNFETCLTRAKGKFVHLLHGDDFVHPGFYDEIKSLFTDNPDAGAAFTDYNYVDCDDRKLDIANEKVIDQAGIVENFLNRIAKRQLIQAPAMVVKRSVYEELGGFYAVHFGEDWEMWSRIASRYPVAYSPRILANYRVANINSISHNSFLTGQNVRDISKVIDIIQGYLPLTEQGSVKKFALEYYAVYCIKVANALLVHNRKAALQQLKAALKLAKSPHIYLLSIRFLLMYFLHFKELQSMFTRLNKLNGRGEKANYPRV